MVWLPARKASIPSMRFNQPPVLWLTEAFSRRLKRPMGEDDHSLPSSAEIKNAWSCTVAPPSVFVRCTRKA